MQSSTICSEINLIKHGDREQLIVIVVLFNKVWWLCFFFFFPTGDLAMDRDGRAVGEIERETCKVIVVLFNKV